MKTYEVKLAHDTDPSVEISVRFQSNLTLSAEGLWNMALALLSLPPSEFKLVSATPV